MENVYVLRIVSKHIANFATDTVFFINCMRLAFKMFFKNRFQVKCMTKKIDNLCCEINRFQKRNSKSKNVKLKIIIY